MIADATGKLISNNVNAIKLLERYLFLFVFSLLMKIIRKMIPEITLATPANKQKKPTICSQSALVINQAR